MDRKDLGPVLTTAQLSEVRALLRQLQRSGSLLELAKPSVVSLLRAIDVENDGTTVLVESPRIDETGDIAIPDEVVDLRLLLLECRRERDEARAEVERLREENEGLRKTAHGWFESLQQVEKVRDQMASNWMDWQRRAVELESEMDMLKAEAEQLRAEILAQMTQQAQLQGEYDERQRDAERYRWLRDHYCAAVKFRHPTQEVIVIDDAAIDAAMREGD